MNRDHWEREKEQILNELDENTSPDEMSPQEALECLQEIVSDIEERIDALKGDIARAEESGS